MLKIDEHEKHINELTQLLKVEGVDQAKVSTILQDLRENYTEVDTTIIDTTKKIETINGLNEGLRSANMNLLSKLGSQFDTTKVEDKKEDGKKVEDVKSLDDIALELLK